MASFDSREVLVPQVTVEANDRSGGEGVREGVVANPSLCWTNKAGFCDNSIVSTSAGLGRGRKEGLEWDDPRLRMQTAHPTLG